MRTIYQRISRNLARYPAPVVGAGGTFTEKQSYAKTKRVWRVAGASPCGVVHTCLRYTNSQSCKRRSATAVDGTCPHRAATQPDNQPRRPSNPAHGQITSPADPVIQVWIPPPGRHHPTMRWRAKRSAMRATQSKRHGANSGKVRSRRMHRKRD